MPVRYPEVHDKHTAASLVTSERFLDGVVNLGGYRRYALHVTDREALELVMNVRKARPTTLVSGTIRDSMDDILGKVHEAGLTLKAGCVAPGTNFLK